MPSASDRKRSAYHQRVDFRHDQSPRWPPICNFPEKLKIDRNLLHGHKADPPPVEVPHGHRDDERRSQHLLADKDEGHATKAPACLYNDDEADDVDRVSGKARGGAPCVALTRVEDHTGTACG